MALLSWSASMKFKEANISTAVPVSDWMSQGTCQQVTKNHLDLSSSLR